MPDFKVGDKVWMFDPNHRVYDGKGRYGGSVIYAEHFRQFTIVGETSRSWITDNYGIKASKKDPHNIYTDEQKADNIFINEHRYKISDLVRYCNDADKLHQIARIVEYQEVT